MIRAAVISLALATPASAETRYWDYLVWNPIQMQIDILPPRLDLFTAKVAFGDTLALFVDQPDALSFIIPPSRTYLVDQPRAPRLAGYTYSTPVVYSFCCASDTPPETHTTPVPLPASAWLLVAALVGLWGVRRG